MWALGCVSLILLWAAVLLLPAALPAQRDLGLRLQRRTVEARLVSLGFSAADARRSVAGLSRPRLARLAGSLGTPPGPVRILFLLVVFSSMLTVGLVVWTL